MKDTADDGLEVYLIRFFKYFSEGSRHGVFRVVISSYTTRRKLASRKS